jgi:predicted DNA-binding transcriptional regulator AlpA
MNEFPEIGTVDDVARFLKYSKKTIYKWSSERVFPRGVVIGKARFNMTKLKECIEREGQFLTRRSA